MVILQCGDDECLVLFNDWVVCGGEYFIHRVLPGTLFFNFVVRWSYKCARLFFAGSDSFGNHHDVARSFETRRRGLQRLFV